MAENPDEDHSSVTNVKGFLNDDCTDEDEDVNLQEESRPIVSDASASSSTIYEATKKSDSSSSTGEINKRKLSANAKPWSPDNFRRPDDETSSLFTQPPYQSNSELSQVMMPRGELVRSVTQPSQQNQWLNRNHFPWYHQPNQQLNQGQFMTRLNLGSPPYESNPNNFRSFGMQWQCSRYRAIWIPRNTFQSPMIYRAFILGPHRIYVPWRQFTTILYSDLHIIANLERQYQHTRANQENQYQQRMALTRILETTLLLGDVTMPLFRSALSRLQVLQLESSSQYGRDHEQPSGNSMSNQWLYQQPMANLENLYQHQMAIQENLYQHQMANQENLYQHPMANQENLYQHRKANQENLYQHRMDIMRMLETYCRLGDVTMPQFRSELNYQQVLQLEPQTEQPTETQEPDAESSSQYGRDQEQPK